MRTRLHLVGVALVVAALPARATAQSAPGHAELGARLADLRAEIQGLGQGIEPPDRSPEAVRERASRQLIDAQVAFGTGDHDTAAVMLYEYVDEHPDSPSYDVALYYLAESLFQRGDHLAARERFTELVQRVGASHRFYQQALERLVELSLKLRDDTGVERWLAALSRLPQESLRPSVHYVRGKYAYFQDRFQEAVQHFGQVPLDTEYFFQARYFMGACFVAMSALPQAEAVYRDLVARDARDKDALRVVELSHLALGRVLYETDRLAEAVDAYLEVDRKSDLFEDAVYELTWVFVKQRQFDKALLALELLALVAPNTSVVPSVEILEGNLRIRKAQALSFLGEAQGSGRAARERAAGDDDKGGEKTATKPEDGEAAGAQDDADGHGEYARALEIFEQTRDRFAKAHGELRRVMAENTDPRTFLDQLAGRASETFEVRATLPEVAAVWLREQPGVQQVVAVEQNLEQIANDIARAERSIERLEHALAAQSRVQVFPGLAKKRVRATEILEELFSVSRALARSERAFLLRYANDEERAALQELESRREALARELALLPHGEVPYGERIRRARKAFVQLDEQTAEINGVVDATAATLVALEMFALDRKGSGEAAGDEGAEMHELREELQALRGELDAVRRDTTLARDRAGTGDEAALRGARLRGELRRVLEREQGYMLSIAERADGGDSDRGRRITTLVRASREIAGELDTLADLIDEVVEVSLEDARSVLIEEKARVAACKRELGDHEAEARELGGEIVGASFEAVANKLYEILVRADVGVVDVGWSKKEDSDEALQRLRLDEAREQRMLEDELRLLFGDDAGEPERGDGGDAGGGNP